MLAPLPPAGWNSRRPRRLRCPSVVGFPHAPPHTPGRPHNPSGPRIDLGPTGPGRRPGADVWKTHVRTRKATRLTDQTFTPTAAANLWSRNGVARPRYGVYNLGPCPVPGGKVAFTSNRNAYVPPRGYPNVTLQLFVM